MTIPDPTAVAAVAAEIYAVDPWTDMHGEPELDYQQYRQFGDDIEERQARVAIASYERHLAARASAEDRALVTEHQQASIHFGIAGARPLGARPDQMQRMEAAQTTLLARLAQRPAIDRAELLAMIDKHLASANRELRQRQEWIRDAGSRKERERLSIGALQYQGRVMAIEYIRNCITGDAEPPGAPFLTQQEN